VADLQIGHPQWMMTILREKMVKTGAKVIGHARHTSHRRTPCRRRSR